MTPLSSSKNRLNGLYVITDENLISEKNFTSVIEAALQGGTRLIQYRDKSGNVQKRLQQASALRSLCQQYQAIFLINDDIDLAEAVNAHGVHLGKDDASITRARQLLGKNAIIGVSCYNDLKLAIMAEKKTADYVAFGAIFSSPTKPDAVVSGLDIISTARQQCSIPICAIGGITGDNINQVIQCGANMTAVISSLLSTDDIKQTATLMSQCFFKPTIFTVLEVSSQ